tara:strand:- start:1001 stop:1657 length:657 start_codon:yes stop_codon:yes gene_type:complete
MNERDGLMYVFSDAVEAPGLTDEQKTSLQTEELISICEIDENSVVIDIGANQGLVIRDLVETGCQVYAFEPHPMYNSELTEEFGENDKVHVSNNAVWKKNELADFYFKRSATARNGGATLMSEKTNIQDLNLKITVECVDIADVIGELDATANIILKMDVEGAEYEILERLYESGAYRNVNYIFAEDHSRKMPTAQWHSLKSEVLEKYKQAGMPLYWW